MNKDNVVHSQNVKNRWVKNKLPSQLTLAFVAMLLSSIFASSTQAQSYNLTNSIFTGATAPYGDVPIGTTVTLSLTFENTSSSLPITAPIPISLGNVSGPTINWVIGGGCTPDGVPATSFNCPAPTPGSTITHTFTSSTPLTVQDSYEILIDAFSSDCASNCDDELNFSVGTPRLNMSITSANPHPEGDSGNSNAILQLTINPLPSGSDTSSMQLFFDNVSGTSTATEGLDFIDFGQTVSWTASSNPTQTFNIPIIGDLLDEGDEVINIRSTDETNLIPIVSQVLLTIGDDDSSSGPPPIPAATLSIPSSIGEADTEMLATVSIDTLPAGNAFVTLEVDTGGTATGDDFDDTVSVSIQFTPTGPINDPNYNITSSTSVTVPINIIDDTDIETNETFDVLLSGPDNLTLGTPNSAIATIIDDDSPTPPVTTPPVQIVPPSISASSLRSFSEDSGQAVITFDRSGDLSAVLSFDFQTIAVSPASKSSAATGGGTATAGTDYTSTSATVSWSAGDSASKSVSIPIIDDTLFEGDETFNALADNLTNGASFSFDPNLTITIVENDIEPGGEFNFSSASYDIDEDGGNAIITVTRSGGSNGAASVNFSSSDDSATAGDDYNSAAGTLSWSDGELGDKTFTVGILEDILNEPTEVLNLSLSNPTANSILGSLSSAILSINNITDDSAPSITKDDVSATDFDGDGKVDVPLDATGKIISDNPITDVIWEKDGNIIANGMVTSAKLPVGVHPLRVTATDNNGKKAAVDFIAEVLKLDEEKTRMLSETPGLNTEQGTVAGALDSLCPRLSELGQLGGLTTGQSNLQQRCENLRNPDLADDDIVDALDQIAGEEAEAIIITAARFTNMHQTNLRNRFTQLRRGGSAIIDVSGINFRLDGGSINGHMFANAGKELLGGAASADDSQNDGTSEIFANSKLGLFINGNLSYGERDPSKNNSGFKLDIQGITAGMDYRFTDSFIGGLAVGYSSSDLDYSNDGGTLEGDSVFYSAYSSYYNAANYYIDTSITYAESDFDVTRHIFYRDIAGPVDLRRQGATGGEQVLATADFGWDINSGPWTFGPNGSLSYSDTSIGGYAERGDSGLELQYSGQENITSTVGLGFHGSRVFLMDWGVLIANVNGNYYREFKNQNSIMTASFVHDPFRQEGENRTPDMLILSDIPDRNYFSLGIGLSAQFRYGLSGFIDYQSILLADDIRSQEFAYGLRYEAKF